MAEARLAVEPLPSVSFSAGIDPFRPQLQLTSSALGYAVFIPKPRFLLRSAVRLVKRSYTKVRQAFIPVPLPLVIAVLGGNIAWVVNGQSAEFVRQSGFSYFLWHIDSKLPLSRHCTNKQRVAYLTCASTASALLVFTFSHRLLLRSLLSFTDWIYASRGPTNLRTKLWGLLLRFIYVRGTAHTMLGFQSSLPALPLPALKDTVDRYMLSIEPLCDEAELVSIRELATNFLQKEGKKLQRYLGWKHLLATNYVSDWWLNFVYLRSRDSLMINSNFYGMSVHMPPMTTRQASRAAYAIWLTLQVRQDIDRELLAPMLIRGMVPLCMSQYTRVFNSVRVPKLTQDELVKYDSTESRHIVVLHRGRFYKLRCFSDHTGRLLSPVKLEAALEGIIRDGEDEQGAVPEANIPALTALNRNKWAQLREEYFAGNVVNRIALHEIESAMFFVIMTDLEPHWDDLNTLARQNLHGLGADRWFDKNFQLIVHRNATMGINVEHSYADAPTLSHIYEIVMAREIKLKPYDETGRLRADLVPLHQQLTTNNKTASLYHAERLTFKVNVALRQATEEALAEATASINDLQLHVAKFDTFGKQKVSKVAKCSPDAFIQMALQVAYFRNQGHFTQTYESSMTRLFCEGRTETIRSATHQSCKFVHALIENTVPRSDVAVLLREACDNHQQLSLDAMTGKGVDRHIFALFVVSIGTETPSPFLQQAMKRGWKLSTSQVPPLQTVGEWPDGDNGGDLYPRPSGGFGPVADDGYGVSYVITGNNRFYFHVSSKRSCPKTDSIAMMNEIHRALIEMMALFETA